MYSRIKQIDFSNPLQFSLREIFEFSIISMLGLIFSYSMIYLSQYKYGVFILLFVLIFFYQRNKIFPLFLIYNCIIFSNFIYNPGASTMDFFLINFFRFNDPLILKGVIRVYSYILGGFSVFIILDSLSRKRFQEPVKRLTVLLFIFIIATVLSFINSGEGTGVYLQKMQINLSFFVVFYTVYNISLDRSQINYLIKYVFFSVVHLQIVITLIGLINFNLLFHRSAIGDLIVGTTNISSAFVFLIAIGLIYYFAVFMERRSTLQDKLIFLLTVTVIIMAQSGIQIFLLIVLLLLLNLIFSKKNRMSNLLSFGILASILVIVYNTLGSIFPATWDANDYNYRMTNRYYRMGFMQNPKIRGAVLVLNEYQKDPGTALFGMGPGKFVTTGSGKYAHLNEENIFFQGQAGTLDTRFHNVFGDFGLLGGISYYTLLLFFLFKLIKKYRKNRDVLVLTTAGILLLSIGQSFLLQVLNSPIVSVPTAAFIALSLRRCTIYELDLNQAVNEERKLAPVHA